MKTIKKLFISKRSDPSVPKINELIDHITVLEKEVEGLKGTVEYFHQKVNAYEAGTQIGKEWIKQHPSSDFCECKKPKPYGRGDTMCWHCGKPLKPFIECQCCGGSGGFVGVGGGGSGSSHCPHCPLSKPSIDQEEMRGKIAEIILNFLYTIFPERTASDLTNKIMALLKGTV